MNIEPITRRHDDATMPGHGMNPGANHQHAQRNQLIRVAADRATKKYLEVPAPVSAFAELS